jgi:hypothetical protein
LDAGHDLVSGWLGDDRPRGADLQKACPTWPECNANPPTPSACDARWQRESGFEPVPRRYGFVGTEADASVRSL